MSKKILLRFFISLALVTSLAPVSSGVSSNVVAQNVLTGDWTASVKESGKIHLSFERLSAKGSKNQMGQSYDFSDLQGLSREQALSAGPVKFSLMREAGTIECEGSFQKRQGLRHIPLYREPELCRGHEKPWL